MNGSSQHAKSKYLPYSHAHERYGICLSGGGFRAALFHLGMLRRLNELGMLAPVDTISSVSGGSIVNGILAKNWRRLQAGNGGVFLNFDSCVSEPIERFVASNLRIRTLLVDRLLPWNWPKLARGDYSATDLLATYYDRKLYRGMLLRQLPAKPKFIFTATNLRTGALWELRQDRVGEILLGYSEEHKLRLADAVAASSAYPLAFPPLVLRFPPTSFEGGVLGPKADRLRQLVSLTDGAVYDNLGLEPLWKEHGTIVCSDGGQAFPLAPNYRDWLGNRLLRSFDVIYDQTLEVRKRWLVTSFIEGTLRGTYVGLAAYHGNYGLPGSIGYPSDVVDEIRRIRTDLDAFSREEVMTLQNHGYTLTDTAVRRYMPEWIAVDTPLQLPYPQFVDRTRILAAIDQSDHISLLGRRAA